MELLRTEEVIKALNISKMQVYHLMRSGKIRFTNVGRGDKRPRYRFFKEDVDKIINRENQYRY